MSTTAYAGTKIAADGRRHPIADVEAGDVSDEAPTAGGKFVTEARFSNVDRALSSLARTVDDGVLVEGDKTFESDDADFTSNDVGAVVSGEGVPEDTTIASVTDQNTVELSNEAYADVDPATVTIKRELATAIDQAQAIDDLVASLTRTVTDAVFNSTTAVDSNNADFDARDVGASVTGTGVQPGTTIASVTDENTVVLSLATTATGTGKTITIVRKAGTVIANHETRIVTLETA